MCVVTQVGVGEDLDADALRAIASYSQSYTALIASNWTQLTSEFVDKLTDLSCNGKSTRNSAIADKPRDAFRDINLRKIL